MLAEGFDYQGEPSVHRSGRSRGEPSAGLPPTAFVSFLQNHDHVGNRAFGERLGALAEPAALRGAVAILLLSPSVPLLFMGEEWQADEPFLFFSDLAPELAVAVRDGAAATSRSSGTSPIRRSSITCPIRRIRPISRAARSPGRRATSPGIATGWPTIASCWRSAGPRSCRASPG